MKFKFQEYVKICMDPHDKTKNEGLLEKRSCTRFVLLSLSAIYFIKDSKAERPSLIIITTKSSFCRKSVEIFQLKSYMIQMTSMLKCLKF